MSETSNKPKSNPDFWWTKSVIYELYVDKFAGDFRGLTEKLDYFKYLGVNTLWLLPFYPSAMADGGYDVSDYTSIRNELGSMEDFDGFIKKAHEKKLRIIIDFVLNHTSENHPWFSESRSSKDNPKRDWYLWADDDKKFSQAFVHFSDVKNSNWIKNDSTGDYYYATFYPQQPDLNWDNPQVYNAMVDVARFWLSKGVDGFRLDAVSRLVKRDGTNCFALDETHGILKRMRKDLSVQYPNVVFLAESGGWPDEARTFFGDQDECQIVLNFPLASNILTSVSDHDTQRIQKVWDESGGIGENCRWGVFLTNHDSVDLFFLTSDEEKNKLSQNGELIGKFGEFGGSSFAARLSEICQGDRQKIVWAHRQMLTLPGVPVMYYGNEIGMSNEEFSHKPRDCREYVRGKFDWEEAEAQMKDSNSILNGVKKLISSR